MRCWISGQCRFPPAEHNASAHFPLQHQEHGVAMLALGEHERVGGQFQHFHVVEKGLQLPLVHVGENLDPSQRTGRDAVRRRRLGRSGRFRFEEDFELRHLRGPGPFRFVLTIHPRVPQHLALPNPVHEPRQFHGSVGDIVVAPGAKIDSGILLHRFSVGGLADAFSRTLRSCGTPDKLEIESLQVTLYPPTRCGFLNVRQR